MNEQNELLDDLGLHKAFCAVLAIRYGSADGEALKPCIRIVKEEVAKAKQRYEQENMGLRRLLCLHHGCSVVGLYWDDGEMQCAQSSKHIIDFKRMSVRDLELWLTPEENRDLFIAMRDGNFGQEKEKANG